MSEAGKSGVWAPEARSQLRAIDREAALRILHAVGEGRRRQVAPANQAVH